MAITLLLCREEGIRTLETVTRLHAFQACSFNHSDTSLVRAKSGERRNRFYLALRSPLFALYSCNISIFYAQKQKYYSTVNSPLKSSCKYFSGLVLYSSWPKTNINFANAASLLMSPPPMTPDFFKCLLVS
jgi:hypothetical protein